MRIKFLDENSEEGQVLSGSLYNLMTSKVKAIYQTKTSTEKEERDVETVLRFRDLLNRHGISGPGKGDPEIQVKAILGEELEGGIDLTGEAVEEILENLPWEELTEINGIGTARAGKIREKLLGGEEG